ncbi:thymidylate kinase [Catenovulum agarivorans DS-2]|uniref:Thymidylate kinase n=1 Tax=Catenovulum agarivorans DS-2 TaxID=1328313 RepID=W7QCS1_9ALTE|nr:dTMP kinase [Catenovulum agarivorans]EWH09716.1 thymidylate kinase [Catenovulum agarivorans DS-2]
MSSGKFIVIEGLEGAGKSSAITVVTQFLEANNIDFVQTREPGGTPLAENLRTLVKSVQQEQVTAETELLIMYASRSQLIHNVMRPALEAGKWVVGDRHDMSSRAYQGGGRQISAELLEPIRQCVLKNFKPDLTIYLDVSPQVGLARAQARGELDRIELEQVEFFQRTRQAYLDIAHSEANIEIVDAEQSMDKVHADIQTILAQYFS